MKWPPENLRTLLILGRVSNLPTVWSNLVAGWILGWGDFNPVVLTFFLLGGSFLYIGGMYLNDFCDAGFDARYCPERPIPVGKISRRAVGIMAILWFAAGLACLAPFGWFTNGMALLLLAAIVLYDFRHKNVSWAPLVMGFCRFLLYPLAASVTSDGMLGYIPKSVMVFGAALGLYVAGITYLARGESRPGRPARWALVLLLLPVVTFFGLIGFFAPSFTIWAWLIFSFFSFLQLGWMAWLLVPFWRKINRSIGRVVSGLLAGIVLVDMIAVSPIAGFEAAWLLVFFVLALLLQRIIPAT